MTDDLDEDRLRAVLHHRFSVPVEDLDTAVPIMREFMLTEVMASGSSNIEAASRMLNLDPSDLDRIRVALIICSVGARNKLSALRASRSQDPTITSGETQAIAIALIEGVELAVGLQRLAARDHDPPQA